MNMENMICEKLLDLMEKKPLYTIKVTEFVKYIGISRSTFYIYFDSIYSVVQTIEDTYMADLCAPEEWSFPQRVNAISDQAERLTRSETRHLIRNIRTFRILSSPNGDPSFEAKIVQYIKRCVRCMLLAGQMPSDSQVNEELLVEYYVGGQWALLKYLVNHIDAISANEVIITNNILFRRLFLT